MSNIINLYVLSFNLALEKRVAALELAVNITKTSRSLLSPMFTPTAVFFSANGELLVGNKSVITYTNVGLNVGNGVDGKTGIFQVPVGGLYAILFNATVVNNSRFDIYLNRNNELIPVTSTKSENGIIIKSLSNILRLFKNELLSFVIYRDVNDMMSLQAQFSGYLLMALDG